MEALGLILGCADLDLGFQHPPWGSDERFDCFYIFVLLMSRIVAEHFLDLTDAVPVLKAFGIHACIGW